MVQQTGSTVTVPNVFKLPVEYEGIGLEAVLNAWGVNRTPVGGGMTELHLPDGWELIYPDSLKQLRDENGAVRMRVLSNMVTVELPVVTGMTGDYVSTQWVGVSHHDEEVFRSTTFPSITYEENDCLKEGEDAPILSDEELEQSGHQLYSAVEPYYEEAEAFVRKHYPLLGKDPNAYW